jgi:hypothetical protein
MEIEETGSQVGVLRRFLYDFRLAEHVHSQPRIQWRHGGSSSLAVEGLNNHQLA